MQQPSRWWVMGQVYNITQHISIVSGIVGKSVRRKHELPEQQPSPAPCKQGAQLYYACVIKSLCIAAVSHVSPQRLHCWTYARKESHNHHTQDSPRRKPPHPEPSITSLLLPLGATALFEALRSNNPPVRPRSKRPVDKAHMIGALK